MKNKLLQVGVFLLVMVLLFTGNDTHLAGCLHPLRALQINELPKGHLIEHRPRAAPP